MGSMALVASDLAVGDPASELFKTLQSYSELINLVGIGNAVLLANWTRPDLANTAYSFVAFAANAQVTGYSPVDAFSTTILGPASIPVSGLSSFRDGAPAPDPESRDSGFALTRAPE